MTAVASSTRAQGTQSTEVRVMTAVASWLNQGKDVWLCTIVKTWGSSPRQAGAVLAFQVDDGIVGSLSGGCIEEALIRQFSEQASENQSAPMQSAELYDYSISTEDQAQYKLPCGGKILLLIERLFPVPLTLQHFNALQDKLKRQQRVSREVMLLDGAMHLALPAQATNKAVVEQTEQSITTVFGPSFKMLLLGAGEVSYCVANIAMSVGFSVTLCDPREAFIKGYQQTGVEVIQCLPDDLVKADFSGAYNAILALAHDPRVDDMALMEALKTNAFYVGAMGSARTSEARRNRLLQLACSSAELRKLHSPIGINIGSKTPAEIAISVMAQVLAERNKFLGRLASEKMETLACFSGLNAESALSG